MDRGTSFIFELRGWPARSPGVAKGGVPGEWTACIYNQRMPGEQPKGHHYVTRAYLEGFTDPALGKECYLWLYMPGKTPFRQRPERVAKRNYYYCYEQNSQRQFHAEHVLQKLEDVSLLPLRQLRAGNFHLSAQDRLTFAGYIALSFTRVPSFERESNLLTAFIEATKLEAASKDKEMLAEGARLHREETGEDKTPEEFQKQLTGGSIIVSQTSRAWSLGQMMDITMRLQMVIVNMKWTFLLAPTDDPGFLTSDNPVAVFDPRGDQSGKIAFASSPAAYFTFPICRSICLSGQHVGGPLSSRISAAKVREVNKGTIIRSDTQVYAPFDSDKIQELVNRAVDARPRQPQRVLFSKGRVVVE